MQRKNHTIGGGIKVEMMHFAKKHKDQVSTKYRKHQMRNKSEMVDYSRVQKEIEFIPYNKIDIQMQ